MVSHRALRIPAAQRAYFHHSGLASQRPILNARAFEISHRRRHQPETHSARDQANHRLHLARMLSDARRKTSRMAVTDDEVI
jgi:hypothetical protein